MTISLRVGAVSSFKMHNIGPVPTFKMHNVGTVPMLKMHNVECGLHGKK